MVIVLEGVLYTVYVVETFSDGGGVGRVRMGEVGGDYAIGEEVLYEANDVRG